MSDTDPELDDYDETEDSDTPEGVKRLREANKREQKKREALEAELATVQRERAFEKAGIDTDTPQGKFFADKYEGDLNAETIQSQFQSLFGGEAAPAPEPTPEETQSTDERAALASNATPDTGEAPKRPVRGVDGEAVRAGMQARNEHGAPMDDAMGVGFNVLVGAAMDGDESVIRRAPKG